MFRYTITIDAPPEAVFEELSHVERHPGWANPKAQMTMEQVEGAGPGKDSTYRSSGIFSKAPITADISVTAFEPGRVFAIRSDQRQDGKKDSWFVNTYRLTAQGDGTVVEKTIEADLGPLIGIVAGPAIKKDSLTSLGNLKRVVESRV